MSIIKVTRQQLEEQNLTHLLADQSSVNYDLILEVYYWHSSEPQAMLCILAGIGEIMDND